MSTGALMLRQLRFERRQFWRNPSAAFFTFLLPPLLLVLVATAFDADHDELEILVPGIAAIGIMASTFTGLAFRVTYLRENGILKRVRGTPYPPLSFLGGMIGSAVLNGAVQVVLISVLGNVLYDVAWPQDVVSVVVFTVLGVICFAALGVAFSHAIPNFDSAPAYINAVFIPLIFISGAFYSADELPAALEAIASALPLKPLIDGLAGGIVDGSGLEHLLTPLGAVGAWAAAGLLIAVRAFRWE